MIRLLVVLDEADGTIIAWRQYESLDRAGAEATAQIVVVSLTQEPVAAGLGDRADDAAERAAVFSRNTDRLDLHFLQILEDGVLARLAAEQAVRRDTVNGELVLRAAGTVHLET